MVAPTARVAHTRGRVATVIWHDGARTRKTLLPLSVAKQEDIALARLKEGIDVDCRGTLEHYLQKSIQRADMAGAIAESLRASDIWTAEDVIMGVKVVKRVFARVYGEHSAGEYSKDMAAFIRTAREA